MPDFGDILVGILLTILAMVVGIVVIVMLSFFAIILVLVGYLLLVQIKEKVDQDRPKPIEPEILPGPEPILEMGHPRGPPPSAAYIRWYREVYSLELKTKKGKLHDPEFDNW
jgi:hypothetical protein